MLHQQPILFHSIHSSNRRIKHQFSWFDHTLQSNQYSFERFGKPTHTDAVINKLSLHLLCHKSHISQYYPLTLSHPLVSLGFSERSIHDQPISWCKDICSIDINSIIQKKSISKFWIKPPFMRKTKLKKKNGFASLIREIFFEISKIPAQHNGRPAFCTINRIKELL